MTRVMARGMLAPDDRGEKGTREDDMRMLMMFSRCALAAVLVWVASIAVIEGGSSGCVPFQPRGDIARQLLGTNVVPPQGTGAYGFASYELSEDGTELRFIITAFLLSDS